MTEAAQHLSNISYRISVIIVNYRSWDKLTDCLESLLKTVWQNVSLQIVVVDNCSNDQRLASFQTQFSGVRFILNSGNHGFAHGCNTGAKAANGEYLFFLNPDTQVHEDVFTPMVLALSALPPFSIVATKKVSQKGKVERVERFFPRWYTLTGIGKALHRKLLGKDLKEMFSDEKDMVFPEWVSGSVVFMRQQDWQALNGWNEKFWMYSEDVDLCKRASSKGGKIGSLQRVSVVHNHGGSSRINSITAALTKSEVYISRHVYIAEHFAKPSQYLVQGVLALKSVIKTAFLALLSLLVFTHPKARISRRLFINLMGYYTHSLFYRTWLSPRSPELKK